jgi:PAS domain S-box-containing protein
LKLHHQFVNDLQELYDIAPCGYVSFSLEGKIVAVNETFLNWSGYLEAEVVSKLHFQELLTVPGNIFFETQFFPLLQLQNIVKAVAFDLVCKDGKILPVLLNATQRTSVSFGAPLIHSAIFDATDRRTYEKELLRARKECTGSCVAEREKTVCLFPDKMDTLRFRPIYTPPYQTAVGRDQNRCEMEKIVGENCKTLTANVNCGPHFNDLKYWLGGLDKNPRS